MLAQVALALGSGAVGDGIIAEPGESGLARGHVGSGGEVGAVGRRTRCAEVGSVRGCAGC